MTPIPQAGRGRNAPIAEPFTGGEVLQPAIAVAIRKAATRPWSPKASPVALDAFRTLALTLESVSEPPPPRSIAFLSAAAGEGRSLSAELLALALGEVGAPVRLLDADPFQRSTEHRRRRFREHARRGQSWASDAPEGQHDFASVTGNGDMTALTAGTSAGDMARIPLATKSFPSQAAFLHEVRLALKTELAIGARVIVDVPACTLSSIGFAVGKMVDAVIYVIRPESAPLEVHREVISQAMLLNINVLGLLLNEG